ncbi:TonB-dependent receptor family protein [Rhodocyclaceae bacterium SMB388]
MSASSRHACTPASRDTRHPIARPHPSNRMAGVALPANALFVMALCHGGGAFAQQATEGRTGDTPLNPVVVTGTPVEADSFDLPISIDSIDMREVQRGNLGVNASEALSGVPGLVIQNRQNFAQDLQISIRGFGARSAFGVRGVKLITDGIPASNPDGQGQAATFNLDTAARIEVMRGPFSTVYGNHAGGVIQLFSRDGEGPPRASARAFGGAWGTTKFGLGFEGESNGVGYVLDASRFDTDGYRDHSEARRDQGFAKFTLAPDGDSRLTLVASSLDQPDTQDPLGVTWDTYRRDPRAVEPVAILFNTRKRIAHLQGGAIYERDIGPDTLFLSAYAGKRSVVQYQAIPTAPQASPRHAGGVIDFDRNFSGVAARWTVRRDLAGGDLTVTAGIDHDRSRDDRQGYQNFIGPPGNANEVGVRGQLRRDEIDTVTSTDPYIQAVWARGRWQWSLGLRHSYVDFDVDDRYIVGVNGDDSGSVSYRRTTPAIGVVYALRPEVNLYASAGAGFETPTLNELSYATPSTGFNFDLEPSRSEQFEAGIKAFVGYATRVNAAVFLIRTRDEIVVAESIGGRTSYINAAETRRRGIELSSESELTDSLRLRAALTWLDAEYSKAFETRSGRIPSGNALPGVPELTAYAELAWEPVSGVILATEALYRDQVYVNDLNDARPAPSHTLVNLRLSAEQQRGAWTFGQLLRLDNAFDRKHIGSVIVGAANGRFYEPGPERSWYAGISASHAF